MHVLVSEINYYTLIMILYMIIIYFLYVTINNLKSNKSPGNFSNLFNIICKYYDPKRPLSTLEFLRKNYSKKYEKFDETMPEFMSHKFFRNLEFAVAEKIILYCYTLSRKQNDVYIKNLAENSAYSLYTAYISIFEDFNSDEIVQSLQIRILNNVNKIRNIPNLYYFLLTLNDFMNKKIRVPFRYELIEILPKYKFWHSRVTYNENRLKLCSHLLLKNLL